MIDPPTPDEVLAEEQKREAHWDPAERWRVIQETIAWAAAQATVRRNTPERCLELQRIQNGLQQIALERSDPPGAAPVSHDRPRDPP